MHHGEDLLVDHVYLDQSARAGCWQQTRFGTHAADRTEWAALRPSLVPEIDDDDNKSNDHRDLSRDHTSAKIRFTLMVQCILSAAKWLLACVHILSQRSKGIFATNHKSGLLSGKIQKRTLSPCLDSCPYVEISRKLSVSFWRVVLSLTDVEGGRIRVMQMTRNWQQLEGQNKSVVFLLYIYLYSGPHSVAVI